MATRLGPKGLSWTPQRASAFFSLFINNRLFHLLVEPPSLLETWYRLCLSQGVIGPRCYDMRLVALMHEVGIGDILTFNTIHFDGMPKIVAIDPNSI